MKNREKFAKEILDIACKGNHFGVTKTGEIISCPETDCIECLFNDDYDCDISLEQWSESEYLEKPTITSKEKNFLDALLLDCKYIARDGNNRLYIYGKKPIREDKSESWVPDNSNYYCAAGDIFGNMFDFIKWGDVEPWRIEDLKKLEVRE
jgi:hypothetical protein